jgi:hypothetical protein
MTHSERGKEKQTVLILISRILHYNSYHVTCRITSSIKYDENKCPKLFSADSIISSMQSSSPPNRSSRLFRDTTPSIEEEEEPGGAIEDEEPGGAIEEEEPGGAIEEEEPGGVIEAFLPSFPNLFMTKLYSLATASTCSIAERKFSTAFMT